MDAGDFNTRIEIKRLTKTSDNYGGTVSTLSTYETFWAKKSGLKGDVSSKNGKRNINEQIELIIRKKSADLIEVNDLLRVEGESSDFRITALFDSIHKYYTTINAVRLK